MAAVTAVALSASVWSEAVDVAALRLFELWGCGAVLVEADEDTRVCDAGVDVGVDV